MRPYHHTTVLIYVARQFQSTVHSRAVNPFPQLTEILGASKAWVLDERARVDLAMLRPHPATLVPSCPIPKPNTPRSHGDSLTPPTRFQRTRENGAHLVRDSPPPMPLQRLIKFKPDHSTHQFMPQPNTRTENSMPGELYKALSPPECVVFPPNVFTGAHFRQA